jgi:hypothetical protein
MRCPLGSTAGGISLEQRRIEMLFGKKNAVIYGTGGAIGEDPIVE